MKLKINDKIFIVSDGQTILEIAQKNGFKIPSLCYHPDLDVKANCRICVVEISGRDKLVAACSTIAQEGMSIYTDSPLVKHARAINLELILAEHTKKCANCLSLYNCELLRLARVYKIKTDRLANRKKNRRTYRFANAVEIDGTQCIDCSNCVEVCAKQGINYLQLTNSGSKQEITPIHDQKTACVYCGQCALHCPSASAQEQGAWAPVMQLLKDKSKTVIAQFAPAVRVSLGEEFGLPYGTNCEGQIYSVLKKIGFNYVTDINFGADITTMTEAEELLERLNDNKAVFPMMTSCCPAWVAYVEHYHPELISNLTVSRSPQIHLAGALKTYWAEKKKINPKNIIVVSIVPCTAKKYEAARSELGLDGRPLVDYVLTTRELAYVIKKQGIDFKKLEVGSGEKLFNSGSGAAAIYGTTGGVMESALRSAVALSCKSGKNKICDNRLEFKEVRGLIGFKEAIVSVAGKKLKIGVVNGLGNFSRLLPKLKKYHYIEVMSCPGGCIGGGGQPLKSTAAICAKRMEGLYNIDKNRSIRRAHENMAMREYYNWVKKNHLSAKLLHTRFKKNSASILTTVGPNKKSLFGFFS